MSSGAGSVHVLALASMLASGCGGGAVDDEPAKGGVTHVTVDDPGYFVVPPYDARASLVAYLDAFRARVALPPLKEDEALTAAAQAHALYLESHADLFEEPDLSAHSEDPAHADFTGKSVFERVVHFEYAGTALGEVIAFLPSSTGAVRGWIDSVYHRFPLLDPAADEFGYGETGDVLDRTYNVLDLGRGAASAAPGFLVVWPPDGATDVPTEWDGNEIPTPAPPPQGYPSGPVVTLQATAGSFSEVEASIGPAGGEAVPATLLTKSNDPVLLGRHVALIPHDPLLPETLYEVVFFGLLDGVPTSRLWSFTTRAAGCDVIDQDCGPGMGCHPLGGGVACVFAGPSGQDDPCAFAGDCAAGLTCLSERCRPLCDPSLGPLQDGSCLARCPFGVSEIVANVAGICLQPSCAFDASICLEGESCYFAGDFFCAPAGTRGEGATCSLLNDCEPGLACIGIGGAANVCMEMCDGSGLPGCDEACAGDSVELDPASGVRFCLAE